MSTNEQYFEIYINGDIRFFGSNTFLLTTISPKTTITGHTIVGHTTNSILYLQQGENNFQLQIDTPINELIETINAVKLQLFEQNVDVTEIINYYRFTLFQLVNFYNLQIFNFFLFDIIEKYLF